MTPKGDIIIDVQQFLTHLAVRARRPKRLPVVLTGEEVDVVLAGLEGEPLLACMVLYGSGLRLQEGLQLRVKELDFGRGEILVRDGKGQKDRITMLPAALHEPLQQHLGETPLPCALARKYPNAACEWGWQWVFPACAHYVDSRTGIRHRHHVHEAARRAQLVKVATHLLEGGDDIRTVQELLGHKTSGPR